MQESSNKRKKKQKLFIKLIETWLWTFSFKLHVYRFYEIKIINSIFSKKNSWYKKKWKSGFYFSSVRRAGGRAGVIQGIDFVRSFFLIETCWLTFNLAFVFIEVLFVELNVYVVVCNKKKKNKKFEKRNRD